MFSTNDSIFPINFEKSLGLIGGRYLIITIDSIGTDGVVVVKFMFL